MSNSDLKKQHFLTFREILSDLCELGKTVDRLGVLLEKNVDIGHEVTGK